MDFRRVFLAYLEGPNSILINKYKSLSNYVKFIDFPPFPLFGVPWAAVIKDSVFGKKGGSGEACAHQSQRTQGNKGQIFLDLAGHEEFPPYMPGERIHPLQASKAEAGPLDLFL